MPLISKAYAEMNRQMHETMPHYGTSAGRWKEFVFGLAKVEGYQTILDYGCGKGLLKTLLPTLDIKEYDPAIPGKEATPEPADLVCCFDVLEHVEPHSVNAVLRHLASLTKGKFVFNISTRPASKFLPDGRNAHICLRNQEWWRGKLVDFFQIISWEVKDSHVYGEALPLPTKAIHPSDLAHRKRRPVSSQLSALFQLMRDNSAKYGDELHRIKTIETWEGNGTDKPADAIVAINILEHCADVDAALQAMCRLARLMVMVCMPMPEPEIVWRHIFEKRLRIIDWFIEDVQGQKRLTMTGSPAIGVQGVKAMGAVESTERWTNVAWSIPRYGKRIQLAPKHSRRAILCCYGPSITEQVDSIKERTAQGNCDVVSVSGAHDFLIANGIIPTYHVECDPRPHKAINLEKSHPGVQYLIASVCHPAYFERLGDADVRLWHIASMDHTQRLVDELKESSDHIISGGGSVGLRSLPLLYVMGYREYHIFGMDSSFRDEGEKQWAGKHAGKRQDVVDCQCGDRVFKTSPILMTYATHFFEHIQKTGDASYAVYGDGLLRSMCAMFAGLPQCSDLAAKAA